MTHEIMNPHRMGKGFPLIKDGDAFRCRCGSFEWEPCDREGKLHEPVQTWEGHYKCCECGSVQLLIRG